MGKDISFTYVLLNLIFTHNLHPPHFDFTTLSYSNFSSCEIHKLIFVEENMRKNKNILKKGMILAAVSTMVVTMAPAIPA